MAKLHGFSRRRFLATAATLAAGATGTLSMPFIWTGEARAQNNKYIAGMGNDGGNQYLATNFDAIDPKWRRQMVQYFSDEPEGTVVVDTRHHYLYWIWENNTAIRYGVGVGKEGFQWFGRSRVAKKTRWPRWVPPKEMRERHPELPEFMDAGPKNPLGPRALYLFNDQGDTGYRMHGTVAAMVHRHRCLLGLHPHVQRGCDGPLSPLPRRNGRAGPGTYCRSRTRGRGWLSNETA